MTDEMKSFHCVNCSGETVTVLRPKAVERDGKLAVVRDVPMHECAACGEVYLTPAVMKRLDELFAQLFSGMADEAITHYQAAA